MRPLSQKLLYVELMQVPFAVHLHVAQVLQLCFRPSHVQAHQHHSVCCREAAVASELSSSYDTMLAL